LALGAILHKYATEVGDTDTYEQCSFLENFKLRKCLF